MDDTTREEHTRMLRTQKNERVIVIAPVGQDAAAMSASLDAQGFETEVCDGLDGYSREMIDSAGALLLTEEALESPQGSLLLNLLKEQPPWSELPLIILTSGGESRRVGLLNLAAAAAGSVTLLERPVSTVTLMRSV
jgi:hypothetical protein